MKKVTYLFFAMLMSILSWQGLAQVAGESCTNSIVVGALPFSDSGDTATFGSNYVSSDRPTIDPDAITNGTGSGSYLNGDDVVFSYTPSANQLIDVTTTNDDDWIGLWAFTGCPFDNTVGYHVATSGTTRAIDDLPVIAGTTYYFVISTWPSPQSTDFTINIVDVTPTCMAPIALDATGITTTTTDIEWTAGATETAWNISWGEAGYTPGDTDELGTDTASATSYQITGLTSGTKYDFYVQADCGAADGVSTWSGPYGFTTLCDTIADMFEDFESYSTGSIVPECWERLTSATSSGSQTISSTSPASGVRNIYQNTSSTSSSVIVVLPEFSNIDAGTHWLRLKARVASGTGTLSVGYVTDETDYNSYTLIEDVIITNTSYTSNAEYTIEVPNTVPAGARLGIKSEANGTSHYWDDVYWESIPSCFEPTALATTSVTTATADIEWTAGGTETAWNISWGEPGYTPGDADELDTATTSATNYQLTGLTVQTAYDVYVQADCGAADGLSNWVGPVSLTTLCNSIAIPYAEDFDTYGTGSEAFPDCWTRPVTYYAASTTWPSIDGRTGTSSTPNALKFRSDQAIPTYAVSPAFTEDINDLRVSFMLKREGVSSGTIEVGVMSDAGDISTFELVDIIDPIDNAFNEYVYDLNQVALSGSDNFIALRHNSNAGNWFYWLDDFEVELSASCVEPTTLTTTSITTTTADIEWTAGDAETSWNVSWGTPGYTPGDADEISTATASSESYQITGLTAETNYDVYVQADCGGGDESVWNGPLEVYTGYCIPENTGTYFLSSVETIGAQIDINHTATSRATDGYADLSQTDVVIASAGDTFDLTVSANASTHYFFVWIDLDNDMAFDPATETVVDTSTSGYSLGFTEQITIPASLPNGDYRVRVGSSFASSSPDPCGPANGEYKDITLSIVSPVVCDAVTNIDLTAITQTTATVTWTASATASDGYVVDVYEAGTTTGAVFTDTLAAGATSSAVTGLLTNTDYDVYITSDCGSGDTAISDAYEFTTESCDAVTNIDVTAITQTTAAVSWTASATASDGYEVNVYEAGTTNLVTTETATATETSVDLTGLDPATDYDGIITSDCGEATMDSDEFTFTTEAVVCDAVTDVEVTEITAEAATVTWTESATAIDGYTVDVYDAGADISTDAPVFTETVAAGVNSVDLTELIPDTAYDVYVISDCGSGETAASGVVTFATEPTASVSDFDFVKLTLYPNPVSTDLNVSSSKVIDEVQVYNILGQRLMTYKSNDTEVTIDVTKLPSATYLLKVSVEGVMNTARFVKK